MATTTILWAGKELAGDEEVRLRRTVHLLRRLGNDELAADFERFLPERDADWTPEERTAGARLGPQLSFDGRERGDGIDLDRSA